MRYYSTAHLDSFMFTFWRGFSIMCSFELYLKELTYHNIYFYIVVAIVKVYQIAANEIKTCC